MIKNRVVIQRIVVWIVFMIGLKTQASIVEVRYDLDDGEQLGIDLEKNYNFAHLPIDFVK